MIGRVQFASILIAWIVLANGIGAADAKKIDFDKHIKPLLESTCVKCHGIQRWTGDVRVDTKNFAFAAGPSGRVITPGKPLQSTLYTTAAAEDSDPLAMPPRDRDKMSTLQLKVLFDWITEGAEWPDDVELQRVDRTDSVLVASVLQTSCIKCHSGDNAEGKVRLDTKEHLLASRGDKTLVVPFEPENSLLLKALQKPSVHDKKWPKFLTDDDIAQLRNWIKQGAPWTENHVYRSQQTK